MTEYSDNREEVFPVKFLLLVGLLVATVLIGVFLFRILGLSPVGVAPKGEILQEIVLKFEERDRFDVVVYDKHGTIVAESADGKNGFLGVVHNAMKRERLKKRLSGDNFFNIRRYSNGRVSVYDDVTGLEIHANSFGLKNMAVFGSLFEN